MFQVRRTVSGTCVTKPVEESTRGWSNTTLSALRGPSRSMRIRKASWPLRLKTRSLRASSGWRTDLDRASSAKTETALSIEKMSFRLTTRTACACSTRSSTQIPMKGWQSGYLNPTERTLKLTVSPNCVAITQAGRILLTFHRVFDIVLADFFNDDFQPDFDADWGRGRGAIGGRGRGTSTPKIIFNFF